MRVTGILDECQPDAFFNHFESNSRWLSQIQMPNEDAIQIAIKEIQELPYVMEDALNSSDYRRHLAKTLMRRAIQKAFERSKERQI
jgi:CO/xanthine dehydrogenase FAD-binding subunit